MFHLTTILVGDDSSRLENLASMISLTFSDLVIAAKASTKEEARSLIELHQPHVVFISCSTGGPPAFNLQELFPDPSFCIVLVGDSGDCWPAGRGVIARIERPLSSGQLISAVDRVREYVTEKNLRMYMFPKKKEKIIVNTALGYHLLRIRDIVRLEASANYTKIILRNDSSILISKTLMEFEKVLTRYHFFRVHRSHLVNIHCMTEYNFTPNGRYVVMIDEARINIAKGKVKEITTYIEKLYRNKI